MKEKSFFFEEKEVSMMKRKLLRRKKKKQCSKSMLGKNNFLFQNDRKHYCYIATHCMQKKEEIKT